jgi:hypothetical protein
MAFMRATELVARGRMVAGCGPGTHCGQFSSGEHLKLPHAFIIPRPAGIVFPDQRSIMPIMSGRVINRIIPRDGKEMTSPAAVKARRRLQPGGVCAGAGRRPPSLAPEQQQTPVRNARYR